ncbi:MAG: hypothetical protein LBV07_05300, partial [Syntrophobacterales bacterium]|nr:hypothetical protein [Syntrophobacterales bacterium]
MMTTKILIILLTAFSCVNSNAQIDSLCSKETKTEREVYKSETLLINQISEYVYQHISFLDSEGFGKVSCNGMIVVKDNEAIIFDTPADNETSCKLIDWVTQSLKSKIIAVIPTH